MEIQKLLRAFLIYKASRTCLLRRKGHDDKGIAASILTHQASRTYLMSGRGHENKGIAASIPKTDRLQGPVC